MRPSTCRGDAGTESGYEDTRMTQQLDKLARRDRRRDYFAGGLSLGIALGLLFGAALGNPAIVS
jgi:hypothetical protein